MDQRERILSLHADLAFPSARRLQAVLRKEGINASLVYIKTSHHQVVVRCCNHRLYIRVT